MSKTTRTSKKQIHELEAMARETIDASARLYARNEYDATGKAYAVINGTRTAYASNTALYDAVADMVLTKQAEEFQPEPEPIIYATERTEATEHAAHLADLAEQAAQDVETAATICDADAYDNRAQMYAAAAADEATRYDADDATECHAARAARAAEQARATLTARVKAGLTEADTAVALKSDYAHTLTTEAIEKAGVDPAAIVNEAMQEATEATNDANAAARALLAEYAETTGRTIEQDDDEYIAAHKVARDEVTGVSARATASDRETVAAMVEAIAQAVRDDMPTGPEDYHAELVRKADDAAASFCAAYTDTTGIVPFFEDAAAVCRVARADVAHEYGVTASDRETVSAMIEELADATRRTQTAEPRPTYQRYELLAYLGEPDDYDVTAIEHDATAYDPATGRTVWAVDAETLAAIAERHQLQFYAPAF